MKRIGLFKIFLIMFIFIFLINDSFAQNSKVYFSIKGRKVSIVIGQDIVLFGLYIENNKDQFERFAWKNGHINDIAVDKNSNGKNIFLACGNGIMRSTDYGKNWKILTSWELTEALKVIIDPNNSNIIYTATAYGIWKTTDYGETWSKKVNGLKITSQTYTFCIDIHPSNSNRIFVGTADGVMVSSDGGETWKESGLQGREINDLKISPYDPNIILAATEDHGVYITKDGGKIWKQINMGLYSMTMYAVAFDPIKKGTIYCGGYKCGFAKSNDFGEKWEKFDNEIFDKDITKIAIDPNNSQIIYAGGMEWGLWKSIDGGKTFKCIAEADGKVSSVFISK
jgi:hypothetical protein